MTLIRSLIIYGTETMSMTKKDEEKKRKCSAKNIKCNNIVPKESK